MARGVRRTGRRGGQDTRRRILRASERLFAAKGFEQTSVRDIARASGVNIATTYYYFKDKRALYREVLEGAFLKLSDALSQGVERGKGPEEKLFEAVRTLVGFLRRHRDVHRIILRETFSGARSMDAIVKRYISKDFEMLGGLLEKGVREGLFRRQDTALTVFSLLGMILFYFTYEPIYTKLIPKPQRRLSKDEGLAEHIFGLFMDGIRVCKR